MSFLGAAPLKKFNAPFRTSIAPSMATPRNPLANQCQSTVKPYWPFFAAGMYPIIITTRPTSVALLLDEHWNDVVG